jgi:mannose-6-phosphate isomerase
MNDVLYPIKFKPILKEKIWGGDKLVKLLGKKASTESKIGESWEISGLETDISIVDNGFLKGNSLNEIIEIYMGDLLGESVFEKYGNEFPLLFKFIDASETLSIQVHPDDDVAQERHQSNGKTEMWYIIDSEEGASLINGFKQQVDSITYMYALNSGNLNTLLNYDLVKSGDTFFIPAGRVHGIGAGIVLAEIQQSSDVTYRIYDWGRLDDNGNPRDLHTDEARDVIDYSFVGKTKTEYQPILNRTINLVECPYFKTNLILIDNILEKDYNLIDSFVVYMCVEGSFKIKYHNGKIENVEKGESLIIPAVIKNLELIPEPSAKILEIYIPDNL